MDQETRRQTGNAFPAYFLGRPRAAYQAPTPGRPENRFDATAPVAAAA